MKNEINNISERFRAKIVQFRKGVGHFSGIKVILEDIIFTENNKLFRDHTWVNMSHRFSKLKVGDNIEFNAVRYEYISIEGKKIGLKNIRFIEKI